MSCVNCGCSTAITSTTGPKGDRGATGAAGSAAAGIVVVTSATYAPTAATVTSGTEVYLDRAAGIAVTLPTSPDVGYTLTFIVKTTITSNTTTITAAAADFYLGFIYSHKSAADEVVYTANAALTDHIVTLDGTIRGGIIGTVLKFTYFDTTNNLWYVSGYTLASGAGATPFS